MLSSQRLWPSECSRCVGLSSAPMRTSRIGHRSHLRQPGQDFDTQADPQSTRSASLPGTCWPLGGAAAAWTTARHFTPISRSTRRPARRLHGQVNGSWERGTTPLPAFASYKPNLPIAATCAAMATGGPGGGLLFGFTVVRNAVSTVVVARISSLILPIPEMRAHEMADLNAPPRSRYPKVTSAWSGGISLRRSASRIGDSL